MKRQENLTNNQGKKCHRNRPRDYPDSLVSRQGLQNSPGQVAQLVGALSSALKSCGFYSVRAYTQVAGSIPGRAHMGVWDATD